MTQTLTNKEIIELFRGLQSVASVTGGSKWAYVIAKNLRVLKPEIESLEEAYRPSDGFMEYEQKRVKLAESHAVKKGGKPQMRRNDDGIEEYVLEAMQAFDNEHEALKAEYKEVIEGREAQLKDVETLLNETVEVSLHHIGEEYIPDGVNGYQLTAIMPIITEEQKAEEEVEN